MIILNLHGFMGEPDNKNYNYLKKYFPNVELISPKLDYINDYPVDNLNMLKNQFESLKKKDNDILVVGQSLGAFYALCLCKCDVEVVITNPCLMPFETLPRLSDKINRRHIIEYAQLFSKIFTADNARITTIVGKDDEIVDHSFTKRVLGETHYFEIDGGHSNLNREELENLFLRLRVTNGLNKTDEGEKRMNVKIYSREAIEKLLQEDFPDNIAIISFYDPAILHIDKKYSPVDYSDKTNRVFNISLHDIDIDILDKYNLTYETYFPEADELARFIYTAKADGLDIICQCEYGQSRSSGCAAAILEHFYKKGLSIFVDYRYYPNQMVFHKVFDALEAINDRDKGDENN